MIKSHALYQTELTRRAVLPYNILHPHANSPYYLNFRRGESSHSFLTIRTLIASVQLPVTASMSVPYYKPLHFAYNHLNPPYTSSAWVSCKSYPIPSVILHLSTLPTFNLSSMRYTYQLRRSALSQFNLQLASR